MKSGINVISGTNGTCKTSLLHMISNAYQAVNKSCVWLKHKDCLDVIKQINNIINPKIESLTKGDKKYNDPAQGVSGTLYSIDYFNHSTLEFRKHNSKVSNRYAVKPWYKKGTSEKLPYCPVIYLGLTRLYPFGEFKNDDAIKEISKTLPSKYQEEIVSIYQKMTGINISAVSPQKMGDVKIRADFESDKPGIDSNTISAGEDNVFIIISALISLKYYFDSIDSQRNIESVLLIDEFDATLHPSLQIKLIDLLREYSQQYKIQIIFTTHSLSVLEYTLKMKDNVVYLIDNIDSVLKMEDPDIYKIKMYLHDLTRDDIYLGKAIPLFTEDNEARVFLKILLSYFEEKYEDFSNMKKFFHIVEANIGADNLKNIFNDSELIRTTMKCICILDGDQVANLNNYTIKLPGNGSPEKVIMEYALSLYENNSRFWTESTILELNYGKVHFRDNIMPDIQNISLELEKLKQDKQSTHGKEREMRKKTFIKHQRFFELLFKYWTHDDVNKKEITIFYKSLWSMFKKVAEFHGINPKIWTAK